MKNTNKAGHLCALLTIIIWGTTFISTKVLLVDFQPVEILFFRFVMGFLMLLIIYPHRLTGTDRKQEIIFAAAGGCGICLYYLLENIALTYTMASNVGVIISVAPFLIAILSHLFLKEEGKLRARFFIGFAVAIAGIFLISFNGSKLELNPVGDLLALLADKLGFDFYDQKIIEMAAGTTGMTPEFIEKREETMTNSLLYDLVNQMYQYRDEKEEAPKDKIFAAESKVIKELADKGNCVIIGRCSDYVLKDDDHVLKIFFNAPMESRIKRVMSRLGLAYSDAQHKIRKEDKYRADNYRYYTGRIWGASANVDLTINTDMGIRFIENCIDEALNV